MDKFNVSPAMLREKARLIRTLLEESKANHQQLWTQISTNAGMLPRSLAASHSYANSSWHKAVNAHYEHYHQLALNMEKAADAYEKGDHTVKNLFDYFG